MKRTYLLIVVIVASFLYLHGQDTIPYFYTPDGKRIPETFGTIGKLNLAMEEHGRVFSFTQENNTGNFEIVGFKLFTNIPLWIYCYDPNNIKSLINSFNIEEFLHSWKLEFELKSYIKKGTLSDIFILQTLGQPNNKATYFDKQIQVANWTYSNLGVTLVLKNGIVSSYIKTE